MTSQVAPPSVAVNDISPKIKTKLSFSGGVHSFTFHEEISKRKRIHLFSVNKEETNSNCELLRLEWPWFGLKFRHGLDSNFAIVWDQIEERKDFRKSDYDFGMEKLSDSIINQ